MSGRVGQPPVAVGFVVLSLCANHGTLLAQDIPPLTDEGLEIPHVIVTGTRIDAPTEKRSGLATSIDGHGLRQSGNTALVDVLKSSPALIGSRDSSDAGGNTLIAGGTGLPLLNLRNLGLNRTLVLVDGRRHVGALPGLGAVEVDTIPFALIDRVEISTGGASAIYGADGVSGVVNFITRKNFEGLETSVQYGQSTEWDARDWRASVLSGIYFAERRGNLTFAAEYSTQDRLRATERDFSSRDYAPILGNPVEAAGDDPTVPDRVPVRDLRLAGLSADGAVDLDFDGIPEFNGDDTPFNFGSGVFGRFQQGGDAVSPLIGDLLPEKNRYTSYVGLSFELMPAMRFFGDFKYSRTESFAESTPTSLSFEIFPGYPFTPPNIGAAANGGSFLVSRTNLDLGIRNEDVQRDTARAVFGVDGKLSEWLSYEVSYVHGRADIDTVSGNNLLVDRFFAAIDADIDPATSTPACRSSLGTSFFPDSFFRSFTPGPGSGCVPMNIFGNGSISPAAAAWMVTDSRARSRIQQQVAQAFVSGDSGPWFSLPGGPLGFALGIEWRKERSENEPALEDQLGLGFNGTIPASRGEYDVHEAFGEVHLPILSELPFAYALAFDGALRRSDYSTTGKATTWQSGLAWSPVPAATVRVAVARATRAPNIAELFGPTVPAFAFLDDPCDINNLSGGSNYRAANCTALLSGLGVDPTTYTAPTSGVPINGLGTGNERLGEERSKTHTIGLDWRPLSNLVASLGWYDIELRDAVNTPLAQQATDTCVDLPTLDNVFCTRISREPGVGAIASFIEQPINISEFTTEGFDFSLNYLLDPARFGWDRHWGVFNLSIAGNRLKDFTARSLPSAPEESFRGAVDVPKFQANLGLGWSHGALNLRYRLEYFDETQRIRPRDRSAEPDIVEARFFDYDDKLTQNLYGQYAFSAGLSIYAGIDNLTDEKPDIGEISYPVDPRGRFFFVGLTYSP